MSTGIRVFKFGGASIKDPEAVRNMAGIIRQEYRSDELLIVVVSAMGKTTNALEQLLYQSLDKGNIDTGLKTIEDFHHNIISGLRFEDHANVVKSINNVFQDLTSSANAISQNHNITEAHKYDSLVPYGEVISSKIIHKYLVENGLSCEWLDARHFIKTSSDFREGIIDWVVTGEQMDSLKNRKGIFLTQGFIGSDLHGQTTTLGREGSDFTAAIFGNRLQADSITIWKDVPGILNADPKVFRDTTLFDQLSYTEASEMTYYGASVIHPKTIKPLANRFIPLYVKSFVKPGNPGTIISKNSSVKNLPVYILKRNQILLSFKVKDFTFINEEQLGSIFHALDSCLIKINVMQNSAISLTVAVDNRQDKINKLITKLESKFEISITENLTLFTIIDYNDDALNRVHGKFTILLEQRTMKTCQYIVSGPVENRFE